MRKVFLKLGFCVSLMALSLKPARAQFGGVVVCPLCSSEMTTLAMHAQQMMQYIKEAEIALQAIQMAQMMTREGLALAQHPSSNVNADLAMLSDILMQSQGLAGDMAQMDAVFRKTYSPANPDALVSYGTAYNRWATTTLNTIHGALTAAGMQGDMLNKEQVWMTQIQTMNQSPMGRDESLQLGNTIATEEVAQLQKLRQLMITDLTAKAAYTAQQVVIQQQRQTVQQSAFADANWTADGRTW